MVREGIYNTETASEVQIHLIKILQKHTLHLTNPGGGQRCCFNRWIDEKYTFSVGLSYVRRLVCQND